MSNSKEKVGISYDLLKKWEDFLGIILSPSVLIVAVATIFLIIVSPIEQSQNLPEEITNVLTIIISIFSGVVGALISKKWTEINEGSILVTRGKSAIRGLKLLLLNLHSLEQRVKIHLNRLQANELSTELIQNNFEEIIEKCNSLQEEAINAVEEWQDIIPEANIKTQIGFISKLKVEKDSLEGQIDNLKEDLKSTKSESEEVSKELSKELKEKESELKEVKSKLREKERELSTSILSGMSSSDIGIGGYNISEGASAISITSKYKCSECGHEFNHNYNPGSIASALTFPNCPKCGSNNVEVK